MLARLPTKKAMPFILQGKDKSYSVLNLRYRKGWAVIAARPLFFLFNQDDSEKSESSFFFYEIGIRHYSNSLSSLNLACAKS